MLDCHFVFSPAGFPFLISTLYFLFCTPIFLIAALLDKLLTDKQAKDNGEQTQGKLVIYISDSFNEQLNSNLTKHLSDCSEDSSLPSVSKFECNY